MLAAIEVLIGLFAILSIWEFRTLDDLMVSLTDRVPSWQMFVMARYAGAFLIMFIPTLLMGIAFPLASKIYSQNQETAGQIRRQHLLGKHRGQCPGVDRGRVRQ